MKKPPKILLFIVLLALVIAPALYAEQYKVTWVTDGDTIKIAGNGQKVTIRLVGIDAPETSKRKNEPGQPFSQKSKKYLASLVLNKSVRVESYGTGRYGRTLGVVFVGGKNVNLEMVKVGLAEVYRGKPAKGLDIDLYRKVEAEARKAKIGMWSLENNYISPRDWRRMKKE